MVKHLSNNSVNINSSDKTNFAQFTAFYKGINSGLFTHHDKENNNKTLILNGAVPEVSQTAFM